jgi:hypothetical protein
MLIAQTQKYCLLKTFKSTKYSQKMALISIMITLLQASQVA